MGDPWKKDKYFYNQENQTTTSSSPILSPSLFTSDEIKLLTGESLLSELNGGGGGGESGESGESGENESSSETKKTTTILTTKEKQEILKKKQQQYHAAQPAYVPSFFF